MLYSNHSSLDICSPHAAAESFQDLSRRNNCGFWHTLLTWSIVVNALHAGGSYTGMRGIHTCHSACYFRLGPCCCLCGARGDSVQTGSHLSYRILQTRESHMCIQEVLNKRGVHQSQKLRLLLQYSPLARYITRRFVCARPLWKCEYVRLCCAMPSIR